MPGFADEIKNYKNSSGKETTAISAAEPEAATEAAAELPTGFEMPKHGDMVTEAERPAEAVAARTSPEASKESDKPKIKIGKREFESVEEAVAYAAELEQGRAEDQAYIEGVKAAQANQPAEKASDKPKTPTAYEKFSKQVFEDPEAAAKEFAESIKQELRSEYVQTDAAKEQAKAAQAAQTAAWDVFFQSNPDLSEPETQDYIRNYLLPKAINEKSLKPTSTPAELAELARKHLKIQRQASLPTKELQAKTAATPASAGEATSVATNTDRAEKVDFITELKKLRKKAK